MELDLSVNELKTLSKNTVSMETDNSMTKLSVFEKCNLITDLVLNTNKLTTFYSDWIINESFEKLSLAFNDISFFKV